MTKDPDFETLRQDLRALHDSFIDAHVRKRPEILIDAIHRRSRPVRTGTESAAAKVYGSIRGANRRTR